MHYASCLKILMKYFFASLLLVFTFACGQETDPDTTGDGLVIIIASGNIFATPDLTAPSGSTVVILNRDDSPHSITSQSAEDTFDNTGTFDVLVASDGTNLLTLPEATSGTVFFFYDRFYEDSMSPASGTITIE